ncbi:MAG: hypothetical protein ACOY94_12070 [Bacillota bacterium]
MRKSLLGLLITTAIWLAMAAIYSLTELLRGGRPFTDLQWNVGWKFFLVVVVLVLALGTAIGHASDRIGPKG